MPLDQPSRIGALSVKKKGPLLCLTTTQPSLLYFSSTNTTASTLTHYHRIHLCSSFPPPTLRRQHCLFLIGQGTPGNWKHHKCFFHRRPPPLADATMLLPSAEKIHQSS
ncbi:hypothetical protein L1887_28448 [Cichorium endivia]|nr:hypothetical protein L1887_28448 [Cichorium endivia]